MLMCWFLHLLIISLKDKKVQWREFSLDLLLLWFILYFANQFTELP